MILVRWINRKIGRPGSMGRMCFYMGAASLTFALSVWASLIALLVWFDKWWPQ